MDHFKEWTTSWGEKAVKGPEIWGNVRASDPLAGAKKPGKGWKPGKVVEPVDHSGEWPTSREEAPPRAQGLTSEGLSSYTDKVTN